MGFCGSFVFPIIFLFCVKFIHTRLTPTNISWDNAHNITSKRGGQCSFDYAFAWVLGGIREEILDFVRKTLISANILRREGSVADFWVYTRLSQKSIMEELSDEEIRMFRALDVNFLLLDQPKKESFAQVVYDTFTTNMTRYKRVMFLDGDMMPKTNLDYVFHLSDPDYQDTPTLLKPNLIMATKGEPCNTDMFMVEPSQQNFEKYLDAVGKQRQKAKSFPYPHFDFNLDKGWGHYFKGKEKFWESVNTSNGEKWRWHASHSDQGLMYAKYIFGDVSIVIGDRVQNWRRESGDKFPTKESDMRDLFFPFRGELLQHKHSYDSGLNGNINLLWQRDPQ